jgi:hypothetical protein
MPTLHSRRSFLSGTGQSLFALSIGAPSIEGCGATDESRENITPYQFGASGDGRSDDTIALQRAVNAAMEQGRTLDLFQGTFKVTNSVVGRGEIRIVNTGGAVVEAAPGRYQKFGVIVLEGSARKVANLLIGRRGDTRLQVSSGQEFKSGDLGAIYNPADFSYSGFRRYYRAGEFFEVDERNDGTLTIRRPLYDDYGSSPVEVYKIDPVQGYVKNLMIRSGGAPESLLVVDYSRGFEIIDPIMSHGNNDCIVVNRSVNCLVRNPRLTNAGDGRDDYGLTWSNSQSCRMVGGEVYARRHPVAIGGADQVVGVPCRAVVVERATLRNDPSTDVHCADIHGNSEQCGYEGCLIFGGFSPQGRASFLRGSTVHAMKIGTAVYAAELLGGQHSIEDNTFHVAANPANVSRGVIDFGGNSDAVTSDTQDDLTILVENNVIKASSFGSSTMILYIRNAGSTRNINVRFADNKLIVNNFASAVRMRIDKGIARSNFIDVQCGQSVPKGKYTLHPEPGYYDLPIAPGKRSPYCSPDG